MSPICELDQVLAQQQAQQLAEAWESTEEAIEILTTSEEQLRLARVRKVPAWIKEFVTE